MTDNKVIEEVREAVRVWLKAIEDKDFEKLSTLYDSEAVYANDRSPFIQGPDRIVPWFEQAFTAVDAVSFLKEEVMFVEGNLALVVGKFCLSPTDLSLPAEAGRVALTYRRAKDGRWLLLCDIDNRPPDVDVKEFDRTSTDYYIH